MTVDITIIGGGFSGITLLARLVRDAQNACAITLIDPGTYGLVGPAYATKRMEHRLNVPAIKMGAFAEQPEDFHEWLNKKDIPHAPGDFMPRAYYGDYLRHIHAETRACAQERGHNITILNDKATSINIGKDGYIITTKSHSIESHCVVLATGNHFAAENAAHIIREPWFYNYETLKTNNDTRPVAVIGTGLTGVDTILSLLAHTDKNIICFSRNGWFPFPHLSDSTSIQKNWLDSLGPVPRLSTILRAIRTEAKTTQWQNVIDSLRPNTVALWSRLNTKDKNRVFKKYFTLWNIHRHRMAPDIHETLQAAMRSGRLNLSKTAFTGQTLDASLVFDCRSPAYTTAHLEFLQPLLEKGVVAAHDTKMGLKSIDGLRVSQDSARPLYAIGPLFLGKKLETTAVPELRQQTQALAQILLTWLNQQQAPHQARA